MHLYNSDHAWFYLYGPLKLQGARLKGQNSKWKINIQNILPQGSSVQMAIKQTLVSNFRTLGLYQDWQFTIAQTTLRPSCLLYSVYYRWRHRPPGTHSLVLLVFIWILLVWQFCWFSYGWVCRIYIYVCVPSIRHNRWLLKRSPKLTNSWQTQPEVDKLKEVDKLNFRF